jgi:hypothetical protein
MRPDRRWNDLGISGRVDASRQVEEGTMKTKTWIGIVTLAMFTASGTLTSVAQASMPAPARSQQAAATSADDNMTPYRKLAADTLTAFKAHDMAGARKKAKELESAWDKDQKALQKKSPDVWNQIDKAMDDFIKPLGDKAPDAAKVQAAYDTFIAKLQLAVS